MSVPRVGVLVSQKFIPKNTAERLRQKTPGRLAEVLDHILYSLREDGQGDKLRLELPPKVFVNMGLDPMTKKPWTDIPGLSEDGAYCDPQKALREIYHYLLACALREALE